MHKPLSKGHETIDDIRLRAELAKVIRRLEPGDVLVVTRLDRLARSTRDLLNVLATIAEREAVFRSLKGAWPHRRTAG
jgi:DNA invertase Pin-like site-specific DNA recombinase